MLNYKISQLSRRRFCKHTSALVSPSKLSSYFIEKSKTKQYIGVIVYSQVTVDSLENNAHRSEYLCRYPACIPTHANLM